MTTLINFTTGPVSIHVDTLSLLAQEAVSHRSSEFIEKYEELKTYLCKVVKARQLTILNGSGTLANEAMLAQISLLEQHGLVFSSGEFGERLVEQAKRYSISFDQLQTSWGSNLNTDDLEKRYALMPFQWLLMCHCETSTGVMHPIESISKWCRDKNILLFLDCMSTIGNTELDLSHIAMASCSSGKGLGSVPGLALVFSNIEPGTSSSIPQYLDLGYYKEKNGLPYTLSSNQIYALYHAVQRTMTASHWQSVKTISTYLYKELQELKLELIATNTFHIVSAVFTDGLAHKIGEELKSHNVLVSYESDYLQRRGLLQIAVMGHHTIEEVKNMTRKLKAILHSSEEYYLDQLFLVVS